MINIDFKARVTTRKKHERLEEKSQDISYAVEIKKWPLNANITTQINMITHAVNLKEKYYFTNDTKDCRLSSVQDYDEN
ncbi:hypothetical protein OnM2_087030 [Erysiphe neolycopersici]|uniref:Uncharacterized protein n=1 Tax=Erysiphe neolycopersici TaxID=212602 RepID=A0A420HEE1_9PEZI|nr:hypothetical protein OnM2_087030 [Erysiphe neolycopersici]